MASLLDALGYVGETLDKPGAAMKRCLNGLSFALRQTKRPPTIMRLMLPVWSGRIGFVWFLIEQRRNPRRNQEMTDGVHAHWDT